MEWTAKLKDELSSSASRMKQSLGGLKDELKAVDVATEKVEMASRDLMKTQDRYIASQKRLESATESRVGAEKAELAAMKRLKSLEDAGTKDKRQLTAAKKKLVAASKARTTAERAEKKAAADVAKANSAQEKATQQLRQEYSKLGSAKKKLSTASDKSKKKFSDLGETARGLGKVFSGALVAGSAAAVLGLGKLYMEVGRLSVRFGRAIVDASDLARTTRAMFSAAAGGDAAAGRKAFDEIHELSLRTGEDFLELRREYGTLKSVGVEGKLMEDLLRLRAATKGMGEEAESGWGKLTDAMVEGEVTASQFEDLTKMIAQGKGGRAKFGEALGLSERALKSAEYGVQKLRSELKGLNEEKLEEFGFSQESLKAGPAAAAQLKQEIQSLDPKKIDALAKALDMSTTELTNNLDGIGQLDRELKELDPQEFLRISAAFADANMDLDGMARGTKSFGDRLKNAWEYFKREVGKDVQFDVEGMVGGFVEWMRSPDGKNTIEFLKVSFQDMAASLEVAGKFGAALLSGFSEATGEGEVEGAADSIKALASEENLQAARDMGAAIAWVVGGIRKLTGTAGDIKAWSDEWFSSVTVAVTSLPDELRDAGMKAGSALMSGLTAGIRANAPDPVGALSGVADGLKNVLPWKFDMHSPSKVMEKQADNLMQPLEKRVSNDNAFRGFESLAGSMLGSVSAPAPGGRNITFSLGGLTVQVPEGATVDTEELVRNVEPRLEEMVRNLMARVA